MRYNKVPSNRKFGFFFSFVFIVLSLYFFLISKILLVSIFFSFLSITLLLISFFYPILLKPFNYIWFKLGELLGMIISPIILGAIFFLIFVPVSLFFFIIKRDVLKIKQKEKLSYWTKRDVFEINSESYRDQF